MFDKQYRFKGRHALRVDQLTGVFDELSKAKLIDRNVDEFNDRFNSEISSNDILQLCVNKS